MIARVCAAQMARTIVRALHVAPDGVPPVQTVEELKYEMVVGRGDGAPVPVPQ